MAPMPLVHLRTHHNLSPHFHKQEMAGSNHESSVDCTICSSCHNKLTPQDRPLSCAKYCGRRCHRRKECSSLERSKERDLQKEGIWTCSFCNDHLTDKHPPQYVDDVVAMIQRGGPELLKSMMIEKSSYPGHHYNYLYLDPRRILRNYREFIASIFYVGKGQNTRMTDHCKEAARKIFGLRETTIKQSKPTRKHQTIAELWNEGRGPIIFCCIKGKTEAETLNREASMIDAIGLKNLTNKIRGQYKGMLESIASRVDGLEECEKLGLLLLHDAFETFTTASAEDKREFMKNDFV